MRIAVVALLAIALSGCFGIPQGSADFGDTVAIDYVVVDPTTKAPLVWSLQTVPMVTIDGAQHYNGVALNNQLKTRLGNDIPARLQSVFVPTSTGGFEPVNKALFDGLVGEMGLLMSFSVSKEFVMGAGNSGLGFDVERGLIGLSVNDTKTIISEEDPSRGFSKMVRKPAELGGGDIMRTIPRTQFQNSLGEPAVGMVFQLDQVVSAEVVSFTNTSVEAKVTLVDGEEFDAAIVGAKVVARVNPLTYQFILEPVEDQTFTIQANPMGTPLDLAAGTYRSIGLEGTEAVWAFSSTPAVLVETPIEVHVKVTKVTIGRAVVPDGDYGVRTSPVLPHVEVIDHHHHGETDDGHHAPTGAGAPAHEDDGHAH